MADVQSSPLGPAEVASLIDHLLKVKDPATVGLRRIMRHKEQQAQAYPIHSADYEEFSSSKEKAVFTDDERHVLEIEKQNLDLKAAVVAQKQKTEDECKIAFEKGKAEGVILGKSMGIKEASDAYDKNISEMQNRLGDVFTKIAVEKRSLISKSDKLCTQLACEVAKKILHAEVSANPDVVLAIVKRSLSLIAEKEQVIIRVSQDDYETVSGKKDFWMPVTERLQNVIIEADPLIERGGCIIESNSGMVDARLGVQLTELESMIDKTWNAVDSAAQQKLP